MEVIQIPGYTHEEKKLIAMNYLIPRQISENGIKYEHIEIKPEIVDIVIRGYT